MLTNLEHDGLIGNINLAISFILF